MPRKGQEDGIDMSIGKITKDARIEARGIVVPRLVGTGGGTREIVMRPRHNQLAYGAADAMARSFAAVSAAQPRYIGFVYGSSSDPVGLVEPSDRNQSWRSLSDNLMAVGGNVAISEFSYAPSMSSSDQSIYEANEVTYHAVTSSGDQGTYAFPTSGSTYAGELGSSSWLWHALLLADAAQPPCAAAANAPYTIIARVSLNDGSGYIQKPAGFELSVDWKVVFR